MKELFIDNLVLSEAIDNLIQAGHHVKLRVKGRSMFPFLVNNRDTVTLVPFDHTLKIGMILFYRYKNQSMLHRLIRIEGEQLIMAGDGNWNQTETIKPADIIAVADFVERKGIPINCKRNLLWRLCSYLWIKTYFCRKYELIVARKINCVK